MKQIRFLLAVLMAFVCTTGALAQKYGVKIGGKDVTASNYSDISSENGFTALQSGTVTYDPETATLTLSNANISVSDNISAIDFYYDSQTISVDGYNLVLAEGTTNTVSSVGGPGLHTSRPLTIKGGGTAEFTSDSHCGIYGEYSKSSNDYTLSIENCSITVSGRWGIVGYSQDYGTLRIVSSMVSSTGSGGSVCDWKTLTLLGSQITSPSGATSEGGHAVCDASGNVITGQVVIEALPSEAYAWLDGTTLRFCYDALRYVHEGTTYPIPWEGEHPGWWENDDYDDITEVVFEQSFANYHELPNASWMFSGCENLKSIDGMSNFNTSNVTDMSYMFSLCGQLQNLDLSNFNTSKVTNMAQMFSNCQTLENLNLSNFVTNNVTDMNGMFIACSKLRNLYISSFNTSNVTNMSYMFTSCQLLTSLNVASFNTISVTNMEGMFTACFNLKTIYASERWNTAGVTSSNSMFDGCNSLKGGQGTTWRDTYPTDKTYAQIDGGTSNPGYFTDAIPIDAAHFPDGNFRAWLLEQDYGQDGLLTGAEIAQVTEIDVHYKHIADLTGIEYFKALTDLNCSMNQLTTIDVSKNTALKKLNCSAQYDGNETLLTSLDVSELTALEILDCSNSKMTTLDVSNNKALRMLSCFGCHLTSLDLSQNTELTFLDCRSNHYQLTTLDLSQNIKLRGLIIYANRINGSGMEALIQSLPEVDHGELEATYRSYSKEANAITPEQLTAATIKGWTVKDGMDSEFLAGVVINDITVPDANFRAELNDNYSIGEGFHTFDELDVITVMDLSGKQIADLTGVEYFRKITQLNCSNNQLTTLDLSQNKVLMNLTCSLNQISGAGMDLLVESLPTVNRGSLTVRDPSNANERNVMNLPQAQTAMAKGWTVMDALSFSIAIDETSFPDDNFRAWVLQQSYGQDGILTLEEANQVTWIDVMGKKIADLTGIELFSELEGLNCRNNPLGALDMSHNTKLLDLDCCDTRLQSLNMTGCAPTGLFNCSVNMLEGEAMDAFISSLPAVSMDPIPTILIYNESSNYEYNRLTTQQINAILAKGWHLAFFIDDPIYASVTNAGDVPITKYNFPDNNFRAWLIAQDFGSDYILSYDEIEATKSIDVSGKGISDLTGLEFFSALTDLNCEANWNLSTLDVSPFIYLENLKCNTNALTSLDVSMARSLKTLQCQYNQLTSLTFGEMNGSLEDVNCSHNQLTSLDVSECPALTYLYCGNNQITGEAMGALVGSLPDRSQTEGRRGFLDVVNKNSTAEQNVITMQQAAVADGKRWEVYGFDIPIDEEHFPDEVFRNHMLSLDFGHDEVLSPSEIMEVTGFDLVDVIGISDLTGIEHFSELHSLYCQNNQITKLDVSKNTKLAVLWCFGNRLSELDLSNNPKLSDLYIYENNIHGAAMSALVESLPTVENGDLRVWSAYNEGNVITASQVAIATAKGWKVLDANNDLYAGVPVEKGDANGDGELTIDDAVAVANSIIGQTSVNIDAADVNNDGEVTIADATIIINNVIIADAKAELMTQIKTSKEILDACMAKLREMGSAPDHSDLWSLANEIAADIEAVKTKAANATTQDDIDDCNDDVNAIATKLATLNERINQLMYG